jgi:8-amino-7-oxononanoate synthase
VTGTTDDHDRLECELAAFVGAESSLVFATGYVANLAVVTALADPDTLVISDAYKHASIVDGCRLSRATVAVVAHRDTAAVQRLLSTRGQRRALVITESLVNFTARGWIRCKGKTIWIIDGKRLAQRAR